MQKSIRNSFLTALLLSSMYHPLFASESLENLYKKIDGTSSTKDPSGCVRLELNKLESLIKAGGDVNAFHKDKDRLCHIAIKSNDYKSLDFWIKNFADLNIRDSQGNLPIEIVLKDIKFHEGRLTKLVLGGADIHQINMSKITLPNAHKVLDYLSERKETDLSILNEFIEEMTLDKKIEKALFIAKEGKYTLALRFQAAEFIDQVGPEYKGFARSAYRRVSLYQTVSLLTQKAKFLFDVLDQEYLISKDIFSTNNPLIHKEVSESKTLQKKVSSLQKDCKSYIVDGHINCPCENEDPYQNHDLIQKDNLQELSFLALSKGNYKRLKVLIQHGVNINLANDKGETLSYIAAENGYLKCLDLLIKSGADLDIASKYGINPLEISVFCNQVDCVKLLLENGSNLHHSYEYSKDLIDIGALRGGIKIVRLLEKYILQDWTSAQKINEGMMKYELVDTCLSIAKNESNSLALRFKAAQFIDQLKDYDNIAEDAYQRIFIDFANSPNFLYRKVEKRLNTFSQNHFGSLFKDFL
jgi:ankyrin repeat protein